MERGGNLSQVGNMIWGDLGGREKGKETAPSMHLLYARHAPLSRSTRPGSPAITVRGGRRCLLTPDTLKNMKKRATGWGEIFRPTIHTKSSYASTGKGQPTQFFKRQKPGLDIAKENIGIGNTHVKIGSGSFVITEKQTKATTRHHRPSAGVAKEKEPHQQVSARTRSHENPLTPPASVKGATTLEDVWRLSSRTHTYL